MENLTFEQIMIAVGVVMILIGAYNTYCSGRKNYRDEAKRKSEPLTLLEAKIEAHEKRISAAEERLDRLDGDMSDVKDGQKYLVRGVQALLDHELHNGNSEQMETASKELSKWLTNKI